MNWSKLDWRALDRLRTRFLNAGVVEGPYWTSAEELADYDATFGERIGWKWDAVIAELNLRQWTPRGGTVLDWGCGSGIAGRRVVGSFGPERFDALQHWDLSPLATDYANQAARAMFPRLPVRTTTARYLAGNEPIGLLVVSHVLNELSSGSLAELRALMARASAVVWTEPGTREASRALGALRDEWAREFGLVAPCTHGNPCPLLNAANQRHWCHHFASPPPGIFADSDWVKFGQRAGIDLRSIPYSFVALDRNWVSPDSGLSRVIGRPEHLKPYVRLLSCDARGLAELTVMKRSNPELCKELARTSRPLVYRWKRDGTTIAAETFQHRPAPTPLG